MVMSGVRLLFLTGVVVAAPAWAGERFSPEHTIVSLSGNQAEIAYKGGRYVGHVLPNPTGHPVWHGPCAFYYHTGAVFEGECRHGRFLRGFLRGKDGRTVKFLDIERSTADAITAHQEGTGL